MSLPNKILWYTEATVKLYFPEDRVCCQYCELLETYARNQCRRTGEYIADTRGRGYWCPLEIKEGNNGKPNISDIEG